MSTTAPTTTTEPMTGHTIRLPDPLWDAFVLACAEDHVGPAERIRELVREDVRRHRWTD